MNTLSPSAEGVNPSTISRMAIKEEIVGTDITINVSKSVLVDANNEAATNLAIDTTSDDAREFLKRFDEQLRKLCIPFKSVTLSCKWIEPNPLGVPPVALDSVMIATQDGEEGFLFMDSLENLAVSFGWVSPLLHPVPTALLTALLEGDEKTSQLMRQRVSKIPSLIREPSHEPDYTMVLTPKDKEEEGLEWAI